MTAKIFIDGEAGTTGLQIRARLEARDDLEFIQLSEANRKDENARRDALNSADISILCLPDAAAKEAVALIESNDARVIDASSAHRTAAGWTYGFPEFDKGQREEIAKAARVTNPGCYAISSVAMLHPLVAAGVLPAEWPVTINAISGYTGGGKSLIAEFEDEGAENYSTATFWAYGLGLEHKHVPEIQQWGGLQHKPLFVPSVGRYRQGMLVQLPLQLWSLPGTPTAADLVQVFKTHYAGERYVEVAELSDTATMSRLDPEDLNGTNSMRIHVFGHEERQQAVVMVLIDNLGKGASGQAVQNLNIMLGADEGKGLETPLVY
ncbi:N-acetyl-gamma-glutamyl-phosphate reductase [Hwanghaeella sp.]|uniref:N-acetyl-gamma-glutamyl-phosphate reductase n=1 Tax=Hwanghaeella sp. TaxID=2605943 RepID=UPI003CCC2900